MALIIGQVIENRYRIDQALSQGGYGRVYKAWHIHIKKFMAIKESLLFTAEAIQQFDHEAAMLSHLRHEHLPVVHDYFSIPGQGQYLVMEYIAGQDLGELLELTKLPLPLDEALTWIDQVLSALEYLHSQNPPMIHRDVKPGNIKINDNGKAVLVDFGIAKFYDPNLTTQNIFRSYSPGYAPIEQYGKGRTDARSDIYSTGATLYAMLTGERPNESPDRGNKDELRSPAAWNPSIPAYVEAAILTAMAVRSEHRFQCVADFRLALKTPGRVIAKPGSNYPVSSSGAPVIRRVTYQPTQPMDDPTLPHSDPPEAGVRRSTQEDAPGSVANEQIPASHPAAGDEPTLPTPPIQGGREISVIQAYKTSVGNAVNQLVWDPHQHNLLVATPGTIYTLDPLARIKRNAEGAPVPSLPAPGLLSSLTISPSGDILAGGSTNRAIYLWARPNPQSPAWGKEPNKIITGHTRGVQSVAFSPDGVLLASGSWDATVRIWRVVDGQRVRISKGHSKDIYSVVFSPDGSLLASASWDKTICIWNVADGKLRHTLIGHRDYVYNLAYSPTSDLLASGSWDTTVRVWRVSDGRLLHTLEGHRDHVLNVDISGDGRFLASGGKDKTVCIWDLHDGRLLTRLERHTRSVTQVVFKFNSNLLATGDDRGVIYVWELKT